MPDVEFTNLLAIAAVALLAPLVLGLAPALRFPAVVLEIVAGIVLGPQVLGWVEVDAPVSIVALLGLAFLLFLAGLEIDLHQREAPCCGSASWASSSPSAWASWWDWAWTPPGGSRARPWSRSRCPRRHWAWSCRCSRTPAGSRAPWARPPWLLPRSPTSPRSCCSRCCSRRRTPAREAAASAGDVRGAGRSDGGGDLVRRPVPTSRPDAEPPAGHHRRDPGPSRGGAARGVRGAGRAVRAREHPRRLHGGGGGGAARSGRRLPPARSGSSSRRSATAS